MFTQDTKNSQSLFTQDELRLIERMARAYTLKKRRNISALLKRFGRETDMMRIKNMDNAAIMATHIRAKARASRSKMYHSKKADAIK